MKAKQRSGSYGDGYDDICDCRMGGQNRQKLMNNTRHTLMSLEDLNDFSTLQVPEIHFVIFAARNDPLAARNAKTRGNAEFRVGVACVRLQAAGGVVIPQTDGAVVGGGEDVLRIWRELHVLAGGAERARY